MTAQLTYMSQSSYSHTVISEARFLSIQCCYARRGKSNASRLWLYLFPVLIPSSDVVIFGNAYWSCCLVSTARSNRRRLETALYFGMCRAGWSNYRIGKKACKIATGPNIRQIASFGNRTRLLTRGMHNLCHALSRLHLPWQQVNIQIP